MDVDVVPGAVQLPARKRWCERCWWLKEGAKQSSPEQRKDGDGSCEGDEGQSVSSCVHGPDTGEVQVGVLRLREIKKSREWSDILF